MKKRILSIALAICMLLTLVPTMVFADDVTTAPSVSVYATKAQLMDDTFAPDADGYDNNIGKLAFGINESGYQQQWYILGKDTGVDGDNTVIFADSSITFGYFDTTNDAYKTDTSLWDDCTYADTTPSEVYPNHYGSSTIRDSLQAIASDESRFTLAEQGLMNATTVTTMDTNNNSTTYTTTDKLYLLHGDNTFSYEEEYRIRAGSDDQISLANESYWNSGNDFWLRTPSHTQPHYVMVAVTGDITSTYDVKDDGTCARPASNLNLTNVLFSSAVTEEPSNDGPSCGTIASDKAMTLRLDGSSMDIGTVEYDAETDTIKAQKGSISGKVALVVQGKNVVQKQDESDETDWFYSELVNGDYSISADLIKRACGLSSLNLENCKIWLETVGTDGMIYAVNEAEKISSVEITDIDTPTANTVLDTEAACATPGVSSNTPSVTWTPAHTTAGYYKVYTASVKLTAGAGYVFTDSTTAKVNGNTATSVTKNVDGTLTVTYTFPATIDGLLSITAPKPINVANGTAYENMNLPDTVEIETVGKTATSAPVVWNTTTPLSGSYDPDILTEQIVTLNGAVACPDDVDDNGVSLTTTITITIRAADTVEAPQADLANGTYTSNQSVQISSATEGAVIYYTLDGSTPSRTNGTEYTGPISVTGTELQSVQTTIKAIAVKDKMQDSSIKTFTYTIEIPDITVPTGEIKVDTNSWKTFFNGITFGLFFKDTQNVTITATDNSGDAVTIEYLLSDKELTVTQLDAATFTAYTDEFSINPDNEYVIYARLTDTSGNAAYINSDGIVLDSIAPVISGVENGKTYCEAPTVTVTDKYLDSVTLNGNAITLNASNQFTLTTNGEQKIVATDKAGNKAEIIVTVKNGHTDEDEDNICDNCGSKLHKHTGGVATCKDKAICEICGEPYGNLNSDNHTGGTEIRGAKEATCTEEGYTGDTYCKGCGQMLSLGVAIPKLPHTDKDKDHLCDVCGANVGVHEDNDKDHICDYCGEIVNDCKDDNNDNKCDLCGADIDVNSKTETENKNMKSPQTGNDFNSALWLAFLLSCGGAIIVTGAYSKRKKHSR
ncbi:MAG: chitobiase/beta-hexosaminidase C-terminal domain-containing protein [Eubacterium sp.]